MERLSEALQQAHDLIAEVVKQSANEPSRGLYFVQQHVHKAVPAIVSLKSQIVDCTEEVMLNTEDARDALAAVKCMKTVGPPVIDKILKLVSASSSRLQPPSHPKGQLVHAVTDLGKLLPANHMKGIWDAATRRSSSSTDVQQDQSGNAILSAESSESPSGYLRSVLDSAIQRAGTLMSGSETVSPSTSGFLDVVHTRSGGYVWGAMGRKESTEVAPAASEGQEEQQQEVLDSIPDERMFHEFQAEKAAKLEEWLGAS